MKLNDKKIVITGGGGFLGQYVVEKLKTYGVSNIFIPRSKEYDLRDRKTCEKIVKNVDIVIHLAAQIGGIGFIDKYPGEIFYNNIIMGLELMEASRKARVGKFISVGTVCEYPKLTELPFKEENLWNGYPEETTAPYGWAKKILIVQGKAYRKQYNFNAIHLLPINLYGPRDNFSKESSHVIPSLIRKIIEARDSGEKTVEVWGSGYATREFLYVEDMAEGIVLATLKYNDMEPINFGTSIEVSIKDVATLIMKLAKYKGSIKWNKSKPDGQPRRRLDISKAEQFGFLAKTTLQDGLIKTIKWYEKRKLAK